MKFEVEALAVDRPEPDATHYTFVLGSDLRYVPSRGDTITQVLECNGKVHIFVKHGKQPESESGD